MWENHQSGSVRRWGSEAPLLLYPTPFNGPSERPEDAVFWLTVDGLAPND